VRGHRYGAQTQRIAYGDRVSPATAEKVRTLVAAYGENRTIAILRTTPTTLGKAMDRVPIAPHVVRAIEERVKRYEES
jgi:hypothetical protein